MVIFNDTNKILVLVRSLSREDRKLFAAHKSRAINKHGKSEQEAIIFAAQKLAILDVVSIPRQSHKPKQSALSAFITREISA